MVDINKHKFFLFQILKEIYLDKDMWGGVNPTYPQFSDTSFNSKIHIFLKVIYCMKLQIKNKELIFDV